MDSTFLCIPTPNFSPLMWRNDIYFIDIFLFSSIDWFGYGGIWSLSTCVHKDFTESVELGFAV